MLVAELNLPSVPFSQVLVYAALGVGVFLAANLAWIRIFKRDVSLDHPRSKLSLLLYGVFLVQIAILGVSSFGSIMAYGHMSGYALMAHVGVAGAFVFLLLAIAWLYLPNGARPDQANYRSDSRWWLTRWSAWALIVSSLIAAGTMFASMLPLLGTEDLLLFATYHRYAGLMVVLTACVHLYALMCVRFSLR